MRVRRKVLVFPCGTEIGLEIHRALCYCQHVTLYGGSSFTSTHGRFVYANYIEGLPHVDAADLIPAIRAVVAQHNIDYVFPAHDSAVVAFSEHETALGCGVIGSPAATCRLCRSKQGTYTALEGRVRTPRLFRRDESDIPFPMFVKPDVGQGSKSARMVFSREELEGILAREPNLLLLEYLPGKEYTVDCFTDRHGVLRFVGPRERVRTMSGISVDTRPVHDQEFHDIATVLHETLEFRGAWFFQLKRNAAEELVLQEIGPRVSGGMGLYRNAGVNLPLLSVYDRMDLEVGLEYQDIVRVMDRALFDRFETTLEYDDAYIDLDDTLVIDDKVNPLAIAFIYQCRNRGIRVHLVSRHRGEIRTILKKHALEHMFDSILHFDTLTEKHTRMVSHRAIFIDDSYAERKRVREALGIPTIAVDGIESLLDWHR